MIKSLMRSNHTEGLRDGAMVHRLKNALAKSGLMHLLDP